MREITIDVYNPITKWNEEDHDWDTMFEHFWKTISITDEDDTCKAIMSRLIEYKLIPKEDKNKTNIKMNLDSPYIIIEVFDKKKSRPILTLKERIDDLF